MKIVSSNPITYAYNLLIKPGSTSIFSYTSWGREGKGVKGFGKEVWLAGWLSDDLVIKFAFSSFQLCLIWFFIFPNIFKEPLDSFDKYCMYDAD